MVMKKFLLTLSLLLTFTPTTRQPTPHSTKPVMITRFDEYKNNLEQSFWEVAQQIEGADETITRAYAAYLRQQLANPWATFTTAFSTFTPQDEALLKEAQRNILLPQRTRMEAELLRSYLAVHDVMMRTGREAAQLSQAWYGNNIKVTNKKLQQALKNKGYPSRATSIDALITFRSEEEDPTLRHLATTTLAQYLRGPYADKARAFIKAQNNAAREKGYPDALSLIPRTPITALQDYYQSSAIEQLHQESERIRSQLYAIPKEERDNAEKKLTPSVILKAVNKWLTTLGFPPQEIERQGGVITFEKNALITGGLTLIYGSQPPRTRAELITKPTTGLLSLITTLHESHHLIHYLSAPSQPYDPRFRPLTTLEGIAMMAQALLTDSSWVAEYLPTLTPREQHIITLNGTAQFLWMTTLQYVDDVTTLPLLYQEAWEQAQRSYEEGSRRVRTSHSDEKPLSKEDHNSFMWQTINPLYPAPSYPLVYAAAGIFAQDLFNELRARYGNQWYHSSGGRAFFWEIMSRPLLTPDQIEERFSFSRMNQRYAHMVKNNSYEHNY